MSDFFVAKLAYNDHIFISSKYFQYNKIKINSRIKNFLAKTLWTEIHACLTSSDYENSFCYCWKWKKILEQCTETFAALVSITFPYNTRIKQKHFRNTALLTTYKQTTQRCSRAQTQRDFLCESQISQHSTAHFWKKISTRNIHATKCTKFWKKNEINGMVNVCRARPFTRVQPNGPWIIKNERAKTSPRFLIPADFQPGFFPKIFVEILDWITASESRDRGSCSGTATY